MEQRASVRSMTSRSPARGGLGVVMGAAAMLGAGLLAASLGCRAAPLSPEEAAALAHRMILLDTHIDVPYRLEEEWEDVSGPTEHGDFDSPRAREGGLDAAFFSIYIPASLQEEGGARALADRLIDGVEDLARRAPEKFAMASSSEDVRRNFAAGRFSLLLGMENGAGIEGDLANLEHFRDRGVRYITLTHSRDNRICDSSYDESHTWGGLSPFGREVVAAMNRLGIMVDVSHVSDQALWQVLEITRAPVIASHSSCRAFTPGFERNLTDDMIRAIARGGGVVQVNFGSSFLSAPIRARSDERRARLRAYAKEHDLDPESEEMQRYREAYDREHPQAYASLDDVVRHIDHIVELVGVDHVGFGSDFDGVGDSLPVGLKDVSDYPNLLARLAAEGYTARDLEKIAGGNLLRVLDDVEEVARTIRSTRSASADR